MSETTIKTEFEGSQGRLAAALEEPARPPLAYALFAHCFSCSKDIKAAREIARALRAAGFAVLRFDFTGLGASEGDFANTNFSSNVDDLVKAADFLRREYVAPSILIGHSLGGAAAIVAAARMPEVKGVAVIGAPADAAHVAHHFAEKRDEIETKGEATVQLAGRPFKIRKQFIDDIEGYSVLDAAAAIKKPLLIMHAPFDKTVGVDNAAQLFTAAKHPKSFVSLDTADHLLSDEADARYAAGVLAAWAARYIGVETSAFRPGVETAVTHAPPMVEGGVSAQSVPGRRFAAALCVAGYPFVIDASKAEGGDDMGPNPTRVVEAALAACGVMTIKMYARRKGWEVDSAQIHIRRAEGEDAHEARVLEKTLEVEGPLDDAQRERLLEIADKCPVHRMLTEGVKVKSRLD
ncbi:MAG: alpha/beta fold hydrolase [Parvularculaceae bacterium]